MHFKPLAALAACVAAVSGKVHSGFNYGSYNPDGSAAQYSHFRSYFTTAQNLVGADGWNSARLYTMIQADTPNSIISAIPAAMDTGTTLLLGMWASAGDAAFDIELATLKAALKQYGSRFSDLVVGISVGSEDLYRLTPTSIKNGGGVGASPQTVARYIRKTRKALKGTRLGKVKIGHVDTWSAWVNGSNHEVVQASDWLGIDEYPYYESGKKNNIRHAKKLFVKAFNKVKRVAGKKPIWITETGWPVKGPKSGNAISSRKNAHKFWQEIACKYHGKVNMWWYILFDHGAKGPEFGVVGPKLSTKPYFNLRCPKTGGKKHKKHHHKKHHHKKHHHKKSQGNVLTGASRTLDGLLPPTN